MKKFLLSLILLGFCQLKAQNTLDFDGSNDYIDCGNDTSLQIAGKKDYTGSMDLCHSVEDQCLRWKCNLQGV